LLGYALVVFAHEISLNQDSPSENVESISQAWIVLLCFHKLENGFEFVVQLLALEISIMQPQFY
jgi:hypothetical protein